MNEKQYQSLCGWAARTPARQKCLTACFRLLPVLFVFLYGIGSVCALSALVQKQVGLWIAAFWAIPAAGFLLVTLIRKKLNRPRPAQLFVLSLWYNTRTDAPSPADILPAHF